MGIGWESTKGVGEVCRQEAYLDFWWPLVEQVVSACVGFWGVVMRK